MVVLLLTVQFSCRARLRRWKSKPPGVCIRNQIMWQNVSKIVLYLGGSPAGLSVVVIENLLPFFAVSSWSICIVWVSSVKDTQSLSAMCLNSWRDRSILPPTIPDSKNPDKISSAIALLIGPTLSGFLGKISFWELTLPWNLDNRFG